EAEGLDEEARHAAVIAGWLAFAGYATHYDEPERGALEALAMLEQEHGRPLPLVRLCLTANVAALPTNAPAAAEVFADAWQALHYAREDFKTVDALRHAEYELMKRTTLPAPAWRHQLWQELMAVRWYTDAGHRLFGEALARHIQALKERLARDRHLPPPTDEPDAPFQGIERNVPTSAIQTWLRSAYRTQINLSAIADNKAHIMISVNAILISLIISVLSYRNITETNPMILMPAVIFLVTGLVSLTFAILSARPKVTRMEGEPSRPDQLKRHLIFFGNFASLDEETFERMMDAVMRNGELLYGNMVRDLYHLGRVLDTKYRFLTVSYNVFMVGFILTVLTFLVVFFA
ncbi:MAG: hypothetical protein D6818_09245, partial [Bacteroidetes bacterium]